MKKAKILFSVIPTVCIFIACSSDDDGGSNTILSTEKQIISFQFLAADNTYLTSNISAIVNESAKTITATVPNGTDVTNLIPEIDISEGATITPMGEQNFTDPVTYMVTAEDESTAIYTATVSIAMAEKDILTAILDGNPGHTLDWDTTTDISTWSGVTTNSDGEVTALHLYNKNLTTLPVEIGGLVRLQSLNAANNSLETLPEVIGNLTELTDLYIPGNQIDEIPSEIGLLTNLQSLTLNNNGLTSLPPEIGELTNLIFLALGTNNLTSLPSEITELINLEGLEVGGNPLESIPEEIWQLVNL